MLIQFIPERRQWGGARPLGQVSCDCWPSDLVAGQRTIAMWVVDIP